MRYFAMFAVAAILLAGCQNAEATVDNVNASIVNTNKSAEAQSSPLAPPPSSTVPVSTEEPFLYIEQLESISSGQQLVQVKSNSDIDKLSLEQALKNSLNTSDPHTEFSYTLEWESPRFVQIRLRMLEESPFSCLFNLDEAQTADGRTYKNQDQPYRNKVVVQYSANQGSITLKNFQSDTNKVLPAWDTSWIKNINDNGKNGPSFLFYGKEEHHLYDALGDKIMNIPSVPAKEGSYGNDYGYHEMYSDRFYPEYTYMVLGNKILYKIDLNDFSREPLHSFEKPVYGMSSSPDGSKIAVLFAHDDYVGTGADLLVLDKKGNKVFSKENAASMSHSDGFLFVYPLTWEDNSVLILPADSEESNPLGRIALDIRSSKSSIVQDERLTDQVVEDIFAHEGQQDYYAISKIRWSPDGKLAAYASNTGTIWVYNRIDRTFEFVAAGTLLGWMPDGTLAWADTASPAYTF
ncbi:hypothetical protein H70357_22555 [Paenibacillus sp. FSL H7-0357]|uniref:PD40 domain-containing protein n=1 Tax=Paenibacillus sp. FSL H7-0357 TaxID=1536774 RepID=UPI0004F76E51|nr:PD40 domain-containing protein [Paenibacillus sp. FSL H7-0357]AIQ19182.1 hypothetical protein H70357_22555 [Paenibacillus sp. FSL H7-0357]